MLENAVIIIVVVVITGCITELTYLYSLLSINDGR